jgi:uncharacterized protein
MTSRTPFIGVISDTHGLVRPEAMAALAGASHIVHAGDVGKREVLDALAKLGPWAAVRGNNDRGALGEELAARELVELLGHRILVLHDIADLDVDPRAERISAVVTGHSHRPSLSSQDGVLFVNPGSAGPRRFRLPITVARLYVRKSGLEGEIVEIEGTSPPPRPLRAARRIE